MNILCTGAAGFIASHVIKQLTAAEHIVAGIDCFDPQVHGQLTKHPNVTYNCVSGGCHPSAYEKRDVVIHLAAKVGVGQSMYQVADYVRLNALDTANLLERLTANPPKQLVVASSMSVYGEGKEDTFDRQPVPTNEDYPPHLTSIYALTKYDQEQLCLIWGKANNVPVIALRFFNTYGPGQSLSNPYTGVLAIFASRLLNGKAPIIYEDGQQTRDFVNVSDVAHAVVHAATKPLKPGVYNVGTGEPRTIESVARDLASTLAMDLLPVITGTKRAGDIRHCYADITKLRATGWEPRVEWQRGLRTYCEWLQEQPRPADKLEDAHAELTTRGLAK